jgi:hypothetical protein
MIPESEANLANTLMELADKFDSDQIMELIGDRYQA